MDYDLLRVDYTIAGITYPDTLKVLPISDTRSLQKFVIGDKNGVLQCLSIKDEEPIVQFKTLPGKPITAVELADSGGTGGSQTEKIFAASGNQVKGYTRKGKVFLTVETALSETITCMCVHGSDLILGSGRIVTHYRDLKELHSYTCEDRVLDIAVFSTPSTHLRLLVVIANKGGAVFENGEMVGHLNVYSGPSRLCAIPSQDNQDFHIFYGAADGSIGIISFDGSLLSYKTLVEGNDLGSVICMGWYYGNSCVHLTIGRHDGSIQLYLVDPDNFGDKPRLKYTYFCGEPVTSVSGGCIGTDEGEIIAATFSGRVFALRKPHLLSTSGASGVNQVQEPLTTRRNKLEMEVAKLEKHAANEREKYQRSTRSLRAGTSAPPLMEIQCELSGASSDGWQETKITSAIALDMLLLYCKIKIELQTDSAAVLSICPSQGSSSDFLATVRCQSGTRRLWIRLRYNQALSINLQEPLKLLIYAFPSGVPRVARMVSVKLPLLFYYSRHADVEALEADSRKIWCQLHIAGSFSVAELTALLTEILPGTLMRPSASMEFGRTHSLLNFNLLCKYQRGTARFKSENVSTITLLRDLITKYFVEKSIRIEMSCDIPESCNIYCFEQIEDQFTHEFKGNKHNILRKALGALDLDTGEVNKESQILCEDYMNILEASQEEQKNNLDILISEIVGWYKDYSALNIQNKESDVVRLSEALHKCKLDDVKNILKSVK